MATFTSMSERQDGADAFSMSSGLLRTYEEWGKQHTIMDSTMDSTPRQRRDYLNRMKNLLQFISVIAEFHPVTGGDFFTVLPRRLADVGFLAVVATFRSVALLESDRREN